jgi:hypothetical protein
VVRGCGSRTRDVTEWEDTRDREKCRNLCKDCAWPASLCFQAQVDKRVDECMHVYYGCMRRRDQGGSLVEFEFYLKNLI